MLYEENITFNDRVYKNAYQLSKSLIIDGTLERMHVDEKQTLVRDVEKKIVKQVNMIVHSQDQIFWQ